MTPHANGKPAAPPPPVAETIFRAAVQLAGTDLARAFHAAELVVAAWQLSPARLGLAGYEESHPDSNRVLCELSGAAKARTYTFIERVAPKMYRLTAEGRRLAQSGGAQFSRQGGSRPKPAPVIPAYVRLILEREFADCPPALAAADVLAQLVRMGRIAARCDHGKTWDGVAPVARCGKCRFRWAWRDGGFVAERY